VSETDDEISELRKRLKTVTEENGRLHDRITALDGRILQFTTWIELFEEATRRIQAGGHKDPSLYWRLEFAHEAKHALGIEEKKH